MADYSELDRYEIRIDFESMWRREITEKRLGSEITLLKAALAANDPNLAFFHSGCAYATAEMLKAAAANSGNASIVRKYESEAKLLKEIYLNLSRDGRPTDLLKEGIRNADRPMAELLNRQNSAEEKIRVERPDVRLDDVAGMEEVKDQIRLRLIEPVRNPEEARKHGLKTGGGILLYGPPGTGKTFLAKAVAGELNLPFFSITAADIFGAYVGESENNIRNFFRTARNHPLSVIFIDELESIFQKRSGTVHETTQKVISVILQELDGVREKRNPMLLLGATNAPWLIDEAFMRTGRFDVKAYVGLPDKEARLKIIGNSFRNVAYPVDPDAVRFMAERTEGFSGADLTGIAQKIKQTAFDRRMTRYSLPLFQECLQNAVPTGCAEIMEKIAAWERANEITRPQPSASRPKKAADPKPAVSPAGNHRPAAETKREKPETTAAGSLDHGHEGPLREIALEFSRQPILNIDKLRKMTEKACAYYRGIGELDNIRRCRFMLSSSLYFSAIANRDKWSRDNRYFQWMTEAEDNGNFAAAGQFMEEIGCRKQKDGSWSRWTVSDEQLIKMDFATPPFVFCFKDHVFSVPAVPSIKAMLEDFSEKIRKGNEAEKWCSSVNSCCGIDCKECILCSNAGDSPELKVEAFLLFMAILGISPGGRNKDEE